MESFRKAKRLRILVGQQERWHGQPLYEAIVRLAQQQGLAGATCLKGCFGFDTNGCLQTVKPLQLSEDLPITIEIVDSEECINRFLPQLSGMINEGSVSITDTLVSRADGTKTA